MGFFKLPFLHVQNRVRDLIPSRRSVVSGSAVVALLAGPVGLAAANAASLSPAAASVVSAPESPAAKSAAPKPAPAAKAAAPAPVAVKTVAAVAAVVPAKPAPPADPYVADTVGQLEPSGLYGSQQHFSPSDEQWRNAKTIVQVAKKRRLSPYAAVIAVSVAMQESSLRNLTSAVDADSLGLFQQRPSMGWGSSSELTDPAYATSAFLDALKQYAPGYDSMPLWQAAQDTQRSGYPTAYARWEDQAAEMVHQIVAE